MSHSNFRSLKKVQHAAVRLSLAFFLYLELRWSTRGSNHRLNKQGVNDTGKEDYAQEDEGTEAREKIARFSGPESRRHQH
jgi:hypothetical protein